MKISVKDDPYLYWPEWIMDHPLDAFPTGKWMQAYVKWGPGRRRKFVTLMVGIEEEEMIGYSLAVEYETGDKQVAELAHGGGISWTDYFLQYEKLMLVTVRLGPGSSSTLVDTSIYERKIRARLDHLGNTGAWELYQQFAKRVYAELTPESPAWKRERIMDIWNQYIQDCESRFPGTKIAV